MSNNNSLYLPFFFTLGILFVILKLSACINWAWIWVLAPFWVPLLPLVFVMGVFVFISLVFLVGVTLIAIAECIEDARR